MDPRLKPDTTHENLYWATAEALMLATSLASSADLPTAGELRQRVIGALDKMVADARTAGIADNDIAEARYAFVAFIDEQILKTTWSGRSEWMNQPLQLLLYREFTAGENFFARMRSLLQQQNRPIALQAYYLCLASGFRGAFGQTGNEQGALGFLEAARAQLFRVLPPPNQPSPNAKPRDRASVVRRSRAPFIALLAMLLVMLVGGLVALKLKLRSELSQAKEAIPVLAASRSR
jgi:type VI secretion system protein ImpK